MPDPQIAIIMAIAILLILGIEAIFQFQKNRREKKFDNTPIDKLSSTELFAAIPGSCTCLTKTSQHEYHKEDCKYRIIIEELNKRLH